FHVTGVQTCALPIYVGRRSRRVRDVGRRSRRVGDIGQMHPSMVAHVCPSTRIVVQIDTQQLPSAGMWPAVPSLGHCRPTRARGSVTIVSGKGPAAAAPADRNREGRQIFVDALTELAEASRNPRLRSILTPLTAPLEVAVRGRAGVGCTTVGAALTAA